MKLLGLVSLLSLAAVPTFALTEERSPAEALSGLQSRAACGAPCSSGADCGGSCPLCPITKKCTHIRREKERSALTDDLLNKRAGCGGSCSTSADCSGACRLCAGGGTCHPPHKARELGLVDKRDAALLDTLLQERAPEPEAEAEPEFDLDSRSPNPALEERNPLLEPRACYAACSSASQCSTPCYLCHNNQCVPGRKEKERDLNTFESRDAQPTVEERNPLLESRALCGARCSTLRDCGGGCPLCIRGSCIVGT